MPTETDSRGFTDFNLNCDKNGILVEDNLDAGPISTKVDIKLPDAELCPVSLVFEGEI